MAWYNSSWSHRATVTIDASYVDEAIDWIYIPFSQFDTTWWTAVNSTDGRDIRVTQGDGTTELARYILPSFTDSGTSGTGGMLVDVSGYISTSADVDICVYVGNAGASDYGPTDTYGRNNVFDPNTVAAYLPGETTTDLTGGGFDLTAVSSPGTAASDIEGLTAATYSAASNQYHKYEGALPASGWPVTLEASFYASIGGNRYIASMSRAGSFSSFIGLYKPSSNTLQHPVQGNGGSQANASSGSVSASTWYIAQTTRDADLGTTYGYFDGSQYSNSTTVNTPLPFDRLTLGAVCFSSYVLPFDGRISWAAVHDVERSANYISTRNNNFSSPSTFFAYGPTEDYQANCTQYVELTSAGSTADDGDTTWSNITNALNSLADYAEATLAAEGDITYQLNLTNANGALSDVTGNTIVGIEVEVTASGEDHVARAVKDHDIRLIKGGVVSSTDKSELDAWSDSPFMVRTYGGPTDLWGLSWADTDITGSGFGVSLQFYSDDFNPAIVRVYRVRVRVYYSASSGPGDDGFFLLFQ